MSAVGLMTTLLVGCGAEPGQDAIGESHEELTLGSAVALSPTLSSTSTTTSTAAATSVLDSSQLLAAAVIRAPIIGKYDPNTQWGGFNAYDGLLAGLAAATIECKGSIDPDDYKTDIGKLKPTFFDFDWNYGKTDYVCPRTGKAPEAIMSLIGAQAVIDRGAYAKYISTYWDRIRLNFPRNAIPVCPEWELIEEINTPTRETAARTAGRVGKTYGHYAVKSRYCEENKLGPECAVEHARACSAGGGSQWWVKGNPGEGTVYVDPTWWLDEKYYEPPANPYLAPGYFHAMSYYGALPGSRYGMLARAGEYCSRYYNGYHYRLTLKHVWCSPDWLCLTECK